MKGIYRGFLRWTVFNPQVKIQNPFVFHVAPLGFSLHLKWFIYFENWVLMPCISARVHATYILKILHMHTQITLTSAEWLICFSLDKSSTALVIYNLSLNWKKQKKCQLVAAESILDQGLPLSCPHLSCHISYVVYSSSGHPEFIAQDCLAAELCWLTSYRYSV